MEPQNGKALKTLGELTDPDLNLTQDRSGMFLYQFMGWKYRPMYFYPKRVTIAAATAVYSSTHKVTANAYLDILQSRETDRPDEAARIVLQETDLGKIIVPGFMYVPGDSITAYNAKRISEATKKQRVIEARGPMDELKEAPWVDKDVSGMATTIKDAAVVFQTTSQVYEPASLVDRTRLAHALMMFMFEGEDACRMRELTRLVWDDEDAKLGAIKTEELFASDSLDIFFALMVLNYYVNRPQLLIPAFIESPWWQGLRDDYKAIGIGNREFAEAVKVQADEVQKAFEAMAKVGKYKDFPNNSNRYMTSIIHLLRFRQALRVVGGRIRQPEGYHTSSDLPIRRIATSFRGCEALLNMLEAMPELGAMQYVEDPTFLHMSSKGEYSDYIFWPQSQRVHYERLSMPGREFYELADDSKIISAGAANIMSIKGRPTMLFAPTRIYETDSVSDWGVTAPSSSHLLEHVIPCSPWGVAADEYEYLEALFASVSGRGLRVYELDFFDRPNAKVLPLTLRAVNGLPTWHGIRTERQYTIVSDEQHNVGFKFQGTVILPKVSTALNIPEPSLENTTLKTTPSILQSTCNWKFN